MIAGYHTYSRFLEQDVLIGNVEVIAHAVSSNPVIPLFHIALCFHYVSAPCMLHVISRFVISCVWRDVWLGVGFHMCSWDVVYNCDEPCWSIMRIYKLLWHFLPRLPTWSCYWSANEHPVTWWDLQRPFWSVYIASPVSMWDRGS